MTLSSLSSLWHPHIVFTIVADAGVARQVQNLLFKAFHDRGNFFLECWCGGWGEEVD